jgi:O-antigen/teichoic acid export membrane protein
LATSSDDRLTLLSGTGQNVAGLAVYVLASFAANVLIFRGFGADGAAALGLVTLATQLAFVAGAGTRFGMDMAAVRRVAIEAGRGEAGRSRGILRRASAIAATASVVVAVALFAFAGPLADAFARSDAGATARAFRACALALPFVALCQVYLGGTRGLKIMRHTLTVYWTGQPLAWIALTLAFWLVDKSIASTVLAYAGSWALATAAAWFLWRRETSRFAELPVEPGETGRLFRYGLPRAPAALLSQLLFWTDYFVLAHYVHAAADLGVYAAAVRVAQALVLFLTAVSYMFSPFVADLHERGERDRLNALYKDLSRWTVAATIPILIVLAVASQSVLRVFGGTAAGGSTALRILLIGQVVNVAVGAAGFVLIMVGRTGWDLVVYVGSFLLDLTVAILLVPHLGLRGAAIAQATTLVVSNVARLALVWRFARIQPFDRRYFRLVGPGLVAGAAAVAAHLLLRNASWPVDLVGTAVAGTAVYAVLLLLAGMTPEERASAGRLARRLRVRGNGQAA